ncbi:MAG TPA: restriction endonuclease subunit S [Actinomycetota bacterium]|nr:restriction endonuclease subunit S [Actinomycetota bacterium]
MHSLAPVFVDPAAVETRHLLRPGDLLISRSGTLGRAAVYESTFRTATHAGYLVRFRLRVGVDSKFVWYAAQSASFQAQIRRDTIESTIGNFNAQKMGDLRVPCPPFDEQRATVRFLDEKTAKIVTLIAKKQRLTALLSEELRAVATAAIWPNQLPPGWAYSSLMHLVPPGRPIMYGIVLPGPDVLEGVPIVKGGDVTQERLEERLLNKTTFEIEAPYARSRLKGRDLLLTIRGQYGDSALVPNDLAGANITQDVARVAPKENILGEWLLHVLQSETIRSKIVSEALGAAVKGVNIRTVKRFVVPVPPLDEQQRIANQLDKASQQVASSQATLAKAVERLKEYRAALITAAVTGQIDIPGTA